MALTQVPINMIDAASGAVSNRNAIINGQCQVAQRTAPSVTAAGYQYGQVDRIACMVGATPSAGTISQVNSSNFASEYACRIAGVTMGAGGDVRYRYRIEARDAKKFINNTAIFSCIARHDVGSAINYQITINKANAADDFSAVTQIAQSSTISVASGVNTNLPFSASMGNCSNGIEIIVIGACGAVTTKNFDLTDLQFELGSVQSPMERKAFGTELALCMRYYETYYLRVSAYGNSSNGVPFVVPMKVTKRVTPTGTIGADPESWTVNYPSAGFSNYSPDSVMIFNTSGTPTTGFTRFGAILTMSAEL